MVSVPVRIGPALAATAKSTVPLPGPELWEVIVSQSAFDVAVHAQPPPVVTATVPAPPAASNAWLAGAIE